MKTNFKFFHGLGDACQFTIVLQHITKYRPDWIIGLTTNYPEIFPDNVFNPKLPTTTIGFFPGNYLGEYPSTKTTKCLIKELLIDPDLSLFKYKIPFPNIKLKENYVLIHPYGVHSRPKKDMTDIELDLVIKLVTEKGIEPIVIDYKNELKRLSCKRLYQNYNTKDLWDWICGARGVVGIDSGVEHLACGSDTAVHILWKSWHPLNNIEPHLNLYNWISRECFKYLDGKADWFFSNYNSCFYNNTMNAVERICESL